MNIIEPAYSQFFLQDQEGNHFELWGIASAPRKIRPINFGFPIVGVESIEPTVDIIIVNPESFPQREKKPQILDSDAPIIGLHILRTLHGPGKNKWLGLDVFALSMFTSSLAYAGYSGWGQIIEARADVSKIFGFQPGGVLSIGRENISPGSSREELESLLERKKIYLDSFFNTLSEKGLMGENKSYHKAMIELAGMIYAQEALKGYNLVKGDVDLKSLSQTHGLRLGEKKH